MELLSDFETARTQPAQGVDVAETTRQRAVADRRRRLLDERAASRSAVEAILHRQHRDTIARSMDTLVTRHLGTLDQTEASA